MVRFEIGKYLRKMGRVTDERIYEKRHLAATYSPTDTLRSTIGAGGLNYRVRHGAGCTPSAITTRYLYLISICSTIRFSMYLMLLLLLMPILTLLSISVTLTEQ